MMQKKTHTLSLRISDDDAAFLAGYEPEGAVTPSDKVRQLITEARERMDATRPEDAHSVARHLLQPGRKRWRELERETGRQSDLIMKLHDRVPELFGLLMAGPEGEGDLPRFEKALAVEAARIFEDLLALGLSETGRSYTPSGIKGELGQALRLLQHFQTSDDEGGKDA